MRNNTVIKRVIRIGSKVIGGLETYEERLLDMFSVQKMGRGILAICKYSRKCRLEGQDLLLFIPECRAQTNGLSLQDIPLIF